MLVPVFISVIALTAAKSRIPFVFFVSSLLLLYYILEIVVGVKANRAEFGIDPIIYVHTQIDRRHYETTVTWNPPWVRAEAEIHCISYIGWFLQQQAYWRVIHRYFQVSQIVELRRDDHASPKKLEKEQRCSHVFDFVISAGQLVVTLLGISMAIHQMHQRYNAVYTPEEKPTLDNAFYNLDDLMFWSAPALSFLYIYTIRWAVMKI